MTDDFDTNIKKAVYKKIGNKLGCSEQAPSTQVSVLTTHNREAGSGPAECRLISMVKTGRNWRMLEIMQ